jgi:hypothetical protein
MGKHVVGGVLALLTWVGLFAAGVSIDSRPYRQVLGPADAGPAVAAAGVAPLADGAGGGSRPVRDIGRLEAFLGVIAFYTPLNAALLTLLSGLIGGCASRLTFAGLPKEQDAVMGLSEVFRTENPVASMLRSFLVYVAFMAGIFITTNAPFANTDPEQYARLAGVLSFVAFVNGYDPTRFQDLLSLKPGGKKS